MKFTDEQQRAIDTRGKDVLVSAGAGSGKTSVLVERILQMVCGENPIDIDRLLVVTFTDAAAAQMRKKVADELSKRNLRKQMALLSKCHIMTIHSFCLGIARRFFHKIDMDPGFRVADGTEIELMKTEILDGMFEEYYQSYYDLGENPEFVRLAQIFDHNVRDDNFRKLVLDLYEFTRACPDPQGWLEAQAGLYRLKGGLESTAWYDFFRDYAMRILEAEAENLSKALKLAELPGVPQKYWEVVSGDMESIRKAAAALEVGFTDFCDAIDYPFGSLVGARKKHDDISAATIKEIRDEYKKSVADLRGAAIKSPDLIEKDIQDNCDNVRALSQIVLDFAGRFAEAKKEKNMADFADFEHFCLQILMDGDALSAEAVEIQGEFDEIFIDEYQDLSLIQEAILSAVSRKQNRFMVGDVKQCIYQFRMARPEIFVERYSDYENDAGRGSLIHLAQNFRSRKGVIDSVNWLFERLMTTEVGGVDYDDNARLQYAAEHDDIEQDFRTVLHVVDSEDETESDEDVLQELTTAEIEGKVAAGYIKELVGGKFKYSDIVILLRSTVAAQVFAQELKNHDIPAFSGSDDDYFLAQEVMVVLALLQIIDNPHQDIPLTCALYSDIFRFSADELVQIRQCAASGDFYGAMLACAETGNDESLCAKVNSFLSKLNLWREKSAFMTVSQLIFYLYEQTDYYDYIGILPGGKLRRANLMLLFEKAAKYEKTSYKGLFNFIKYIERLQKNNFGFKKAVVANENEELVRIMSIHKSKGLEFPVVFVCNLSKRFNMQDVRRDFMMDYDLGMGFRAMDLENSVTSNTFARYILAKKKGLAQISEEMRILYVAATRAKEKLYFVGTVKNPKKKRKFGDLRPYDVMKGKSFLDWILWAAPQESNDMWNILFSGKGEHQAQEQQKQQALAQVFSGIGKLDRDADFSGQRDEIFRRLSYEYPHQTAIYAPAKMSVSEVKRLYYGEFLTDSEELVGKSASKEFPAPKFIRGDDRIDSADKGIIVHTVLEHVDLNKHGRTDVLALVAELVAKKILSEKEATVVPVDSIVRFLRSDIAGRMRKSNIMRREVPFAVNWESEMVLHGVVDCVFEENDGIVIVDYKTERIRDNVIAAAERYRTQIELYQYAVEKIFGKKVLQRVIYFFDQDAEVVI